MNSTSIVQGLPGSYGGTASRFASARFAPASISSRARCGGSWRALNWPSPFLTATVVRPSPSSSVASPAHRLVARDEQHRTAPVPAQRGVDPRLADERAVEGEVLPGLARDRVVHDAVARARARVHADEERGVATLLEELRVLRPLLLHDELARRIEQSGMSELKLQPLAGAVAVHDDDLRRAGRLRAADGGVDLFGVEPAALLVHRVAARRLLPLDDAGDALHVADDVDLHCSPPCLAAFARDMISSTIAVFASAYCCTYFQSRAASSRLAARSALGRRRTRAASRGTGPCAPSPRSRP